MNNTTKHLWILLLAVAAGAQGATWTVEKDGSGDFTVIQDAIDAAADGDTILIGPGRFDDFTQADWGTWAVAFSHEKSLSFIGSGVDHTIVGPEQFGVPDDNNVYCFMVYAEGAVTRISNLTCENAVNFGIRIETAGRCEVDHCRFRGNSGGVFGVLRDGGWIRNCEFVDQYTEYRYDAINLYTPSVDVEIADCAFVNCFNGFGAYWGGCHDITVRNCSFVGGLGGANFSSLASGAIIDCVFVGQSRYGFVGNHPGQVRLEGNHIDLSGMPEASCWTAFSGFGNYIVRGNVFISDNVVIRLRAPTMALVCEGNHFLRSSPDAWYIRPYVDQPSSSDPFTLDFTDNYWGTSDPDEVAAWIYDHVDDPDHPYTIDFIPMADGPVAVEPRSWSDVKALFERGGGAVE